MKFCKNSIFSGYKFFISNNTVKVGFGYRFWLRKQQFFCACEFFFLSAKIKSKPALAAKKAVFRGEIGNCGPKLFF
jgi:hypothetical protein